MQRVTFGNETTLLLEFLLQVKLFCQENLTEYLNTIITILLYNWNDLYGFNFLLNTFPGKSTIKNMTWVMWPTRLLTTPLLIAWEIPLHLSMSFSLMEWEWTTGSHYAMLFVYSYVRHCCLEDPLHIPLSNPLSIHHSEYNVSQYNNVCHHN